MPQLPAAPEQRDEQQAGERGNVRAQPAAVAMEPRVEHDRRDVGGQEDERLHARGADQHDRRERERLPAHASARATARAIAHAASTAVGIEDDLAS